MQRDIYLESIRNSKKAPNHFLENELNYDSLVEFVQWRYEDDNEENFDDVGKDTITTLLDALSDIGISTLKDVDTLIEKNEKFSTLAIEAYIGQCREQSPEDPDEFVWGPIKIAVAVSANPEWRNKFPWGGFWTKAFIHADSMI